MKSKSKKAASIRRMGAESSRTYARLLDAAAQIIESDGSAAVTARRLAAAVGLKREIVHYYFRTIEDVFIAVMRREGEKVRLALTQAMESKDPLRAIWALSRGEKSSFLEFVVLAHRSKAIQIEVKRYLEEFRSIQSRALARHMELRGIKVKIPPVALILILHGLIQALAIETTLGVSYGHAETEAIIERYLRDFERRSKSSVSRKRSGRQRA
jgi:TetR/AcrR family transcriptional regulator